MARVLAAGVAQPDDEQVERRGLVASTEEAHGGCLAFGSARLAGGLAAGRRLGCALRRLLALGHLLGLDLARRHRQRREYRVGIVEELHALGRAQVGETKRVSDLHRADVEVEVFWDLHRQRLDVHLAVHLRDHAALADARGIFGPDQRDRHRGRDRLVEPHLLQVDVDQPTLDRILLKLLQDRGVRRLLALEHDVEDRVQAGVARQHAPEVALGYGDRMRLRAAVEDTRNQAPLAQAPRFARALALALGNLETDPFTGHTGG